MWYKDFLPKLHEIINAKRYIEIGIRHGYSLSLAKNAKKIAIDPNYDSKDMQFDIKDATFFKMGSDDFFAKKSLQELGFKGFDLAYIDGMHLFEFALRDFINLEKFAGDSSVIIIDDVLPRDVSEASRTPSGGSWTGDVWKIIDCLMEYRPELMSNAILAGSQPTGCLIISYLNSESRVLENSYDEIMNKYVHTDYSLMPDSKITDRVVSADMALLSLENLIKKAT
jgi:hypothetical protein